ncbi:FHL1 (YPR104C) [Zygosaccharomyces parabailii]|nr:FHL1 (YPR104C) [Zygosaccharomyces parabailii]
MDVIQHVPNDTNSVELSDFNSSEHMMGDKDMETQINALAAEQTQRGEHNSVYPEVPSMEHDTTEHNNKNIQEESEKSPVERIDAGEELELPDNIDNDDFSKLLELDAKHEEDLFGAQELLQHAMSEDTGVELQEENLSHGNDARTNTAEDDDEYDEKEEGNQHSNEEDDDENKERKENGESPHICDKSQVIISGQLENESNDSILRGATDSPKTVASDTEDIRTSSIAPLGSGNEASPQLAAKSHLFKTEDEHSPAAILQEKGDLIYRKRHDSLTPVMFQQHEILMSQLQNQNNGEISQPNGEQGLQENNVPLLDEQSTISAYARLDFQSFTFYVQTLHVIIGRRSENDFTHKVDVNLGPSKSISRRHAQIFYNFGTGRFELSIIGKNGAFVDDIFVERGNTVPLKNRTKIQIGQIPFQFILPDQEKGEQTQKSSESPLSAGPEELDAKVKAEVELNKLPEDITTDAPLLDDATTNIETDIVNAIGASVSPAPPAPKKAPVKKEKEKRQPKVPKRVYSLEEIPPEYRTKPSCSYSSLLTTCIRKYTSPKGMSLSEIYAGIRELFPYYKYCPDGWQSSVRHNLSLNKSFRKVSKEGKGWLWGLDEDYIAERERQKKRQAEAAAVKAAAAQQRLEQQQLQRAKKAAAASASGSRNGYDNKNNGRQQSISQTLAANRAASRKSSMNDNQRTMKYLQEQLVVLTKNRKGLSNQVIASILTQALAMTINQVTQAAKSKGITGNPLTALMDKNPQHLNLILAAAVNAATSKVTNGKVKQLVSMSSPNGTSSSQVKSSNSSHMSEKPGQSTGASSSNVSSSKGSSSFDPTSLSKFFQPRQPPRIPSPTSKPKIPQKRSREKNEDSSSSEESSDSDGDDDDENTDDGDEGSEKTGDDDDDASESSTSSDDEESDDEKNDSSSENESEHGNGEGKTKNVDGDIHSSGNGN